MRTFSLLAQKGGAGKTTLAVHLAVLAESLGERVALIDTDPQRSAADWWRARKLPQPAESYHQSWSAQSNPPPAQADVPFYPPPVIVAPQVDVGPQPWRR